MIVLRYALGLVLAAAVIGKLRAFALFRASLVDLGVGRRVALVAAPAIVAAEGLTAAAAFGPAPDVAVGVAGVLLGVAFTAVQTYMLAAGIPAACRCFGRRETVSLWTWLRAAAVLVMGLVLLTATA
jgi:hypothetical protein